MQFSLAGYCYTRCQDSWKFENSPFHISYIWRSQTALNVVWKCYPIMDGKTGAKLSNISIFASRCKLIEIVFCKPRMIQSWACSILANSAVQCIRHAFALVSYLGRWFAIFSFHRNMIPEINNQKLFVKFFCYHDLLCQAHSKLNGCK